MDSTTRPEGCKEGLLEYLNNGMKVEMRLPSWNNLELLSYVPKLNSICRYSCWGLGLYVDPEESLGMDWAQGEN